jgi:O-antigen ligase
MVIALLPLTSVPWVARLAGSDMVAAPAALPLIWLLAAWFVPFLLNRGRLSSLTLPFLAFVTAALVSSALAFFGDVPPFKGRSLLSREIHALLTLAVGASFYLVASTWPKNLRRLQLTLQIVNVSGLVILLWCAVQAYYVVLGDGAPVSLTRVQQELTMKTFYINRVNGFTLEPSWLAHQLNLLYLPAWLASSLQRYSAHRFRLLGISFENLLLVGGVAMMFLSHSRIGWLALVLVAGFLAVRVNLAFARWIRAAVIQRVRVKPILRKLLVLSVNLCLILAFMLAYGAGIYGLGYIGGKVDPRLAQLFEVPSESIFSFQYLNQLAFAERAIYWATGFTIFGEHPLLGVGVGNAGYYFFDRLPAFAFALPEITDLVYRSGYLPNTKSLWVRLLAETGVVGFALFLTWAAVLWAAGQALRSRPEGLYRTLGWMGSFTLIALITEGFSVDSFALPYLWISTGLLTAAASLVLAAGGQTAVENQPASDAVVEKPARRALPGRTILEKMRS